MRPDTNSHAFDYKKPQTSQGKRRPRIIPNWITVKGNRCNFRIHITPLAVLFFLAVYC